MFGVFHQYMRLYKYTPAQSKQICKVAKMIDWVGRAPGPVKQAYVVVVGRSLINPGRY